MKLTKRTAIIDPTGIEKQNKATLLHSIKLPNVKTIKRPKVAAIPERFNSMSGEN